MPVQRRDARASRSRRGARASSSRRAARTPSPDSASSSRRMKRSRVTLAITDAAAIAALVASPPTTGRCSKPVAGHREAVGQAQAARSTRHAAQRVATAPRGSSCAARARRCRARSARRPRPWRRSAGRAGRAPRAPPRVCCLESLSARQRPQVGQADPLVVEQHRRGDQRPGQAAAPGLVGARHEAHAERPVEGEQPAAAAASSWRARLMARVSTTSEEPDALWAASRCAKAPPMIHLRGTGPQNRLSSDDATIVAHHEVVTGRNRDSRGKSHCARRRPRRAG